MQMHEKTGVGTRVIYRGQHEKNKEETALKRKKSIKRKFKSS